MLRVFIQFCHILGVAFILTEEAGVTDLSVIQVRDWLYKLSKHIVLTCLCNILGFYNCRNRQFSDVKV